jgi:hypothetical protein
VIVNVGPDSILKYAGITVRETAGAAAVLRIRVNSATGPILDTIYLTANSSFNAYYECGKVCRGDLYEEHVSGTYEGSAFVS